MADFVDLRHVKQYMPRLPTSDCDFKLLFCYEKQNIQLLADRFLGTNEETREGALSSLHRMKISLHYISDPGYGQELGVSQVMVSRTMSIFVDSIIAHVNEGIKFPTTNREIVQAKQLWQTKYTFPTAIIGFIDCTHIGITKPKMHGDEYINRKGKLTLNVQATCDDKEMFTSVDVRWPGSIDDSIIGKNSQVRLQLRTLANVVLLADDGYGLEPCLMTPFQNPSTPAEVKHNQLFTKESYICVIKISEKSV